MDLSSTKQSRWSILLAVLVFLLVWPQQHVLGFYAQPEALRFIFSPDDVLTCEGCGQVTLTCGIPRQQTAANVPEPELQWMFNSSTVSPDAQVELFSNDSLIISHLIISTSQAEQSGLYRCLAIDGHKDPYCRSGDLPCIPTGTLSNEARVQIISNTDIIQQVSLTGCSTMLLACRPDDLEGFINRDKHQIEWRKDGIDLNISSEFSTHLPNGDLVLSNLGNGNTGVGGLYECLVLFCNDSNLEYNVTVARYRVNVNESVSISSGRDNVHVGVASSQTVYLEGETATLVCVFNLHSENVSSCLNTTGTTWYLESSRIKAATVGSISEDNVLTIHSTLLKDSGNYCCSIEINNETLQACIMISILPQANPSLPISDNPTVFIHSSANNAFQITSFYPTPSQLVWYYNGVELNEQRGSAALVRSRPASSVTDLYGMYQCFVAILGFPQILVKGTRVMPHDRTNPPGATEYKDVVRATFDRTKAPIQISWQPPLYTGNLTNVGYQVYNLRNSIYGFTLDNSIVYFFDLYSVYSVTVEAKDPANNSVRVSDRNSGTDRYVDPLCDSFNIHQVLFRPSLSLSCNDGSVSLAILDNVSNHDVDRDSSRVYYIQGTCVDGNETTYINQKLRTTGIRLLHSFRLGTHCTLQAGASTEDFSTCRSDCYCLDPDLIEYSQPSQCYVTGEVNLFLMNHLVDEENMSVEVCVTIGTFIVLETDLLITLDTSNGTAIAGVDFDEFHADLYLNEEKTTTCINITVRDDAVLEYREYFYVEVSNYDPNVEIINGLARIDILDNDYVNLSFSQAVYSVSEQDPFLTLCVEVAGLLEKNITIVMNSRDGKAIEGADYEGLYAELHLNGTVNTVCVDVTIREDEVLENPESFFVLLSTSDSAVNIERKVEVFILDNDSVNVSVSMTNRNVSEKENSTELCVEVVGFLDKDIIITVNSSNGKAIEGVDYYGIHSELTLNRSHMTQCVVVLIIDDLVTEDIESFNMTLNTEDPDVRIIGGNTEIRIIDDDAPTISSEGAAIGIISAIALFLLVVFLSLCITYFCVTYSSRQTYALKQMNMFKLKDKGEEPDYSDDPVHVSPNPPFYNKDDDAESIYELYDPDGKKPPLTNIENQGHPSCYLIHWNSLFLEQQTEESLREEHITSSDVKTLDSYRKISDSSGFSDDSHYVRYPLDYSQPTLNEATTSEATTVKESVDTASNEYTTDP